MSNSRSKPTVERRNGAKSKALRMSCPPLVEQGGDRPQDQRAAATPAPTLLGASGDRKFGTPPRHFKTCGKALAPRLARLKAGSYSVPLMSDLFSTSASSSPDS